MGSVGEEGPGTLTPIERAAMKTIERDGCRLAYDVRGSGPPVLLIQGAGLHGDGWMPQVDALAARYSCATFDNRGMGQSQPAGERLSIEQMSDDARAVMDALGWDAAHVVGHSMGGLIALDLALRAPARVRSLSLLCTFSRGADVTKPTLWMIWVGLRTRIGTRSQRRAAFLEMVMPPGFVRTPDLAAVSQRLAALFGHDLADQPTIVTRQLGAMSRYDATLRLGELAKIPTLVVSGELDRIARPEFGRKLAAGIPRARYVEIKGAAHGVPIHSPEVINSLLSEHLKAVGS